MSIFCRSRIQWFLTIAGLSGIASIFLSFVWGLSAMDAVGDILKEQRVGNIGFFLFGIPFLSSVVISASIIRWNLSGRLSLLEQVITYLIGFSMVVVVFIKYFRFLYALLFGSRVHELSEIIPLVFSVAFLIAGVFLVIRNHRLGKFKNLSSIMLMQIAYLSNGMLHLIGFWKGGWQIGAYFTLVTMIVYAAQMVWISCHKKETLVANPQEL